MMNICPFCEKPIEIGDDVETVIEEGKGVFVHADCYWEKLGDEVEQHPLGGHLHRPSAIS